MTKLHVLSKTTNQKATQVLAGDPVLRPLIERFGTCPLLPHRNYYQELIESIIGQQLSVKAAASINKKFVALFGGTFPSPDQILSRTPDELRQAGLSGAKARYVLDLAQHVHDGKLEFARFNVMSNDEIVAELLPVKGIGEWTAHMFLLFCMGRTDVLPTGDLGIRTGVMRLYGLDTLPKAHEIHTIADERGWHPYESIASWYIWQSLDNMPS